MSNRNLGEFEQMVLLAILQLGEDVYGVPIVEEIQRAETPLAPPRTPALPSSSSLHQPVRTP